MIGEYKVWNPWIRRSCVPSISLQESRHALEPSMTYKRWWLTRSMDGEKCLETLASILSASSKSLRRTATWDSSAVLGNSLPKRLCTLCIMKRWLVLRWNHRAKRIYGQKRRADGIEHADSLNMFQTSNTLNSIASASQTDSLWWFAHTNLPLQGDF